MGNTKWKIRDDLARHYFHRKSYNKFNNGNVQNS